MGLGLGQCDLTVTVHIEPSQDAHNAYTDRTHLHVVIINNTSLPIPKLIYHIYTNTL
jgi:hypothetical protein